MGGLNQLSLQGQNDIILTGNPQMTFLKLFIGDIPIFHVRLLN